MFVKGCRDASDHCRHERRILQEIRAYRLENWIVSAFSAGGFVGHLSYVLLIVSMMMRDISLLRLFVVASAIVGIAYDLVWLKNPVGVFWEALLLLVNLVQLLLIWRDNRKAKFSNEEAAFVGERLKGLSPSHARHLLDLGRWETLPAGSVLTTQGETPAFLTFIADGEATVEVDGKPAAYVAGGNYIGEMALVGEACASATVRLTKLARVWRLEFSKIDRLKKNSPTIANALQAGITDDMRRKILASNMSALKSPMR